MLNARPRQDRPQSCSRSLVSTLGLGLGLAREYLKSCNYLLLFMKLSYSINFTKRYNESWFRFY